MITLLLSRFVNVAKTLKENDNLSYRDQTIRLFFSNFVVDNEKVADFGLNELFSDFLKTGDFLNGRADWARTSDLLLPKQAL